MSYAGEETIIIATIPSGVETPAYGRKLLRRQVRGELRNAVSFDYDFEGEAFDTGALVSLSGLPWRSGASTDFHTLTLRPADIAAAREACTRVVADLDDLATTIHALVEDVGADELEDLRHYVNDATALLDAYDADTPGRRSGAPRPAAEA